MNKHFAIFILLITVTMCASSVLAQSGTVKGVCKDARGNRVVDGVVVWANPQTGQKYILKTNKMGQYFSLGIRPGVYSVTLYENANDAASNREISHFIGVKVSVDENVLNFDDQLEGEQPALEPESPKSQSRGIAPPPKPSDGAPTLEATMKFIQNKLNGVGPVNHMIYYHDDVEGRDWAIKWNVAVTSVNADAHACRVDFHRRVEEDETVTENYDRSFMLKDVAEIAVMTIEQVKKNAATSHGQPAWNFKADPPVFVVQVRKQDTKETDEFPLFDEQLANRLAKAMVHAVELCGGGGNPDPF